MNYPRIIAHRCGGALAPENSLAGLQIAARLGCRGVEFDVMLAADAVPLLIHDETLERTTNGRGRVDALDAAAIRSFDAGGPFHPAYAVSPTPTLQEALACCAELGLWANIELKPSTGHESITGTIVGDWLDTHWNGHGVISSFSTQALQAARTASPALPLALLAESLPEDWKSQMRSLGARSIHLAARNITPDIATCLHATPWACYTVNQRETASHLFSLGCHAVFTDRPDLWQAGEM